jgi:hypothetical protein
MGREMSRWGVRGVVALVAAAAMTATATPAVAGDMKWTTAQCSSGTIDATFVAGSGLRLEGRVDCADTGTGATFGVAHYYTLGTGMYLSTMRSYTAAAPTMYTVGKDTFAGPGTFALCLVTDPQVRVACVSVARYQAASTTQSGSPMVVTPLPTNDPFVQRPVEFIGDDVNGESSPACGHCW